MSPKTSKRRRVSGIADEDTLTRVYQGLKEMSATFEYNDVPEDQPLSPEVDIAQRTAVLMEMIQQRMDGIKEKLTAMNIVATRGLDISPNLKELTAASKSAGENSFTSSSWMYKHLQMLQDLVPRSSEASARLWIDAFFFRVAAMIPDGQRMILTLERACEKIPVTPSSNMYLLDHINYTAIITSAAKANAVRKLVSIGSLRDTVLAGFFVVEGKLNLITMDIPQAVAEMYACAKHLGQKIFRGALTNGLEWIFIILYLNGDGDGATYTCSEVAEVSVEYQTLGPAIIKEPGPDIIAGILSCWVKHSFSDLNEDDWFQHPDDM